MIDWAWIGDHLGAIADRTAQHLELAGIALAVGFVLSFGLSIWSLGRPRVYVVVTTLAGIVYTIPSLALFQLLVPFTGLTLTTVEIALVGYTLVMLFPNIVAGLRSASDDVIEAARGMGLTRTQILMRIELPLAVPAIIAGLRIAVVSTVAISTIAGINVTSMGLGYPIFSALREPTPFKTEIYSAGVLAVSLAISADLLLIALRRAVVPWARATQ